MRVGAYDIVRKIGQGAYGKVYLARRGAEAGFRTWYALKRLRAEHQANKTFEEYLLREARLGGLVNHPSLVRIHEVLRLEGEYVLVMDYVDGFTLGEALKRHPGEGLADDVCLEVGASVLEALDYIHNLADPEGGQAGFVHRDVKPGNVLITRGGTVKLTDFGVARSDSETESSTGIGELRGTIAYMAPEQACGEVVGPHSDQFSAGLVLLEMLTGDRAWGEAQGGGVLARVVRGDTSAGLAKIDINHPAREAVERLLAKDPKDRYPTSKEAALALRTIRARMATPPALPDFAAAEAEALKGAVKRFIPEPSWTGATGGDDPAGTSGSIDAASTSGTWTGLASDVNPVELPFARPVNLVRQHDLGILAAARIVGDGSLDADSEEALLRAAEAALLEDGPGQASPRAPTAEPSEGREYGPGFAPASGGGSPPPSRGEDPAAAGLGSSASGSVADDAPPQAARGAVADEVALDDDEDDLDLDAVSPDDSLSAGNSILGAASAAGASTLLSSEPGARAPSADATPDLSLDADAPMDFDSTLPIQGGAITAAELQALARPNRVSPELVASGRTVPLGTTAADLKAASADGLARRRPEDAAELLASPIFSTVVGVLLLALVLALAWLLFRDRTTIAEDPFAPDGVVADPQVLGPERKLPPTPTPAPVVLGGAAEGLAVEDEGAGGEPGADGVAGVEGSADGSVDGSADAAGSDPDGADAASSPGPVDAPVDAGSGGSAPRALADDPPSVPLTGVLAELDAELGRAPNPDASGRVLERAEPPPPSGDSTELVPGQIIGEAETRSSRARLDRRRVEDRQTREELAAEAEEAWRSSEGGAEPPPQIIPPTPTPAPVAGPSLRFVSATQQPIGVPLSLRVRPDNFRPESVAAYYQWRSEGAGGRRKRSLRPQSDGSYALDIPASELRADRLQVWFVADPGGIEVGSASSPLEVRVR